MTFQPITERAARRFLRALFGKRFQVPAGLAWYEVRCLQWQPENKNVWLVAGENGLVGVYGAQLASAAPIASERKGAGK